MSLNQLNITDIIENPPDKINKKMDEYIEEESNLLNITETEELSNYIPNEQTE